MAESSCFIRSFQGISLQFPCIYIITYVRRHGVAYASGWALLIIYTPLEKSQDSSPIPAFLPFIDDVLSESFMHLPLRPIFCQSHPNFINVRLKNWGTTDKNLLAKSSTKRFREYMDADFPTCKNGPSAVSKRACSFS